MGKKIKDNRNIREDNTNKNKDKKKKSNIINNNEDIVDRVTKFKYGMDLDKFIKTSITNAEKKFNEARKIPEQFLNDDYDIIPKQKDREDDT